MNTEHIPKSELIHGFYYQGHCRNAEVARWNAEIQRFIYRRHKFGDTWLEAICCPEDDEVYDVFYAESVTPPKDLTEDISFEVYKRGL